VHPEHRVLSVIHQLAHGLAEGTVVLTDVRHPGRNPRISLVRRSQLALSVVTSGEVLPALLLVFTFISGWPVLARWLAGHQPVRYSILFGNEPTATAPAQAVTITDTLNAKLDLTTLTLGPIAFRNQVIAPPSIPLSVAPFTTTVDLRPTTNLVVKVNASLNTSTSTLTWTFQSLDPATNQPPTDPTAGFLPPGGEGSVFFTVMPKQGLPTNTQIQNQATVVFDTKPAINTPTWTNTLDNTPPPPVTTEVASPPPNVVGWNNSNVTIMMNSTDNEPGGSGVKQIQWSLAGAQTASSTVPGSTTSLTISNEGTTTLTYFGTDNAGNVETANTLTIRLDKTPPSITGTGTPSANANGWNNSSVTVSFQCSDSLSGLAAGSPPAPTILTGEGARESVTGTCTDVAGNSATSTVSGINIDKTPPVVTASTNSSTLWPPNGKMVSVTVSGTMADNLSGVNSSAAVFAVQDSYGLVQPSGPVSVGLNGAYSFTVLLEARRNGQDQAGRLYTITVSAQDNAGNQNSASTTVVVPHDQGQN